ncbi:hypothetical protein F5B19DRAFT_399261 [Rostrohypoxylon terebratum]|nr:hypothetical protein F5B19DRAFT_399261 [Rostrohypoxylon terebratum]
MCFDLHIHHTAQEHDTRHLSIINPATGYTVYSPWQDPGILTELCTYPHIFEPIPPNQSCPFHPKCCRLERQFVCRFSGGGCPMRVKYHHFVDEANGETKDISFLSAYFGYNPSILLIAGWFFKAGVELALADKYRSQIWQRLTEMARCHIDGQSQITVDQMEKKNLDARYAHFTRIINCSREVLGQFAILWDLNTGPGVLPPRPGSSPEPLYNEPLSSRLRIRANRWVKRDESQFYWPQLIRLWPNFQAGFLPIGDDPSIVQFGSMQTTDQINSNPVLYLNSQDPDAGSKLEEQTLARPATPLPSNPE